MNKRLTLLLPGVLLVLLTAGVFRGAVLRSSISLLSLTPSPVTMKNAAHSPASAIDTLKTNLRDYIWPTDASTRITSTFAEYRTTHFHGGIDISTNGQTGYHVFSVREGYIYRIQILPNGYGKMLYVRHPDGYTSSYAHLKGFNEAIQRVVHEEQYRRGTYSIDLTPDPTRLPVRKGEIIAYTGNTGFGPPHLHFELRDENFNLINPLLVRAYTMEDNIPPSILRLMISPLSYNSSVENGATPKFFSRFPGRNHLLHNPQHIRIEGEIGFGVDATDRANSTYTHCGIHRMEFYFDDSLVYTMQLDRVPNEDAKEIDLHYDLPSVLSGAGRFQKLYIDVGNHLPIYENRLPGSGIIDTKNLSDGGHAYRIICVDFAGNRTELDGQVVVANKPVLKIATVDDRSVNVEGTLLASISRFTVMGKRFSERRWSQHSLPLGRFETLNAGIELPVNSQRYDVLKIIGETNTGITSTPIFYFKKKPAPLHAEAILNVEPLRNYTRVSLTTRGMFTTPPNVIVKEGAAARSIPLEAIDVNKYIGAFIPSDAIEGTRQIDVTVDVNGVTEHLTKTFELFAVPTNRAGSFSLNYGEMVISFDSGAVYSPLFLRIGRNYDDGKPVFTIDPEDVLLDHGLTIALPKPANSRYRRLGLYFKGNHGWVFRTGTLDSNRAYFSTRLTRTLGEVGIFGDDQPPSIGKLRVSSRHGMAAISFTYRDNLSGVDPDDIKMYIDNKLAIPEINEGSRVAVYNSDEPFARGRHQVEIRVMDRAKNLETVERTFSVR